MTDGDHTPVVRICTRCGEEKPANLENFAPHKMGKFGLNSRCRPCKKIEGAELRSRPDQQKRQKAWRDANKGRVREANLAYRASGYKSTAAVAKWRQENLIEVRKKQAEKMRKRRAEEPEFALKCRLRGRIRHMARGRAGRSTVELLGYTAKQLRDHLERQFVRGMGWHNMGEWEIDHIIPIAAFNIATVDDPDFKVCWALTNLRPLWAHENRAKNDKVLTLL